MASSLEKKTSSILVRSHFVHLMIDIQYVITFFKVQGESLCVLLIRHTYDLWGRKTQLCIYLTYDENPQWDRKGKNSAIYKKIFFNSFTILAHCVECYGLRFIIFISVFEATKKDLSLVQGFIPWCCYEFTYVILRILNKHY